MLVNLVLMSLALFMLSVFEVPVGVRIRLISIDHVFFGLGDEYKTKYRLVRWDILCRPKDQGCLGIGN